MADQLVDLDEVEADCWGHFLESAALLYEALNRRLLAEHRLALFDVRLLELLATSDPGTMRMGGIADALMLPQNRVSAQVRRLEAAGLVHRHGVVGDRRAVVADLTPRGRRRLRFALDTYARLIRAHYLGPLTRRQMIALGDSARRVGAGLRAGAGEGRDRPIY